MSSAMPSRGGESITGGAIGGEVGAGSAIPLLKREVRMEFADRFSILYRSEAYFG